MSTCGHSTMDTWARELFLAGRSVDIDEQSWKEEYVGIRSRFGKGWAWLQGLVLADRVRGHRWIVQGVRQIGIDGWSLCKGYTDVGSSSGRRV